MLDPRMRAAPRAEPGLLPGAPAALRTICVCSGKGGVGKTSVAINLAVQFAERGRSVMLLDADLALANADVLLGLKPKGNLSHVLDGTLDLEDIILDGPAGVRLVPGSTGVSRLANLGLQESAGLINAFAELREPLDVLLVDAAAGISESVLMFARAVQEVLVVVCDEPASMTDAYALMKVLHREHGIDRFAIVASMVDGPADGERLFQRLQETCSRFLDVTLTLLGSVPRDVRMLQAIRSRVPVSIAWPSSPSARALKEITRCADTRTMTGSPWGGVEFFVDRLVAAR